jgi:hypothetical protein
MIDANLTPLESKVLEWLLGGDDPVLVALRSQFASASIRSREMTGVGFYLYFSVPANTRKLHEEFDVKPRFWFGDVEASIDLLERGAGFVLWIEDGLLACLEGYTYDEEWPEHIGDFSLRYVTGADRDLNLVRRWWRKVEPS